MSGQGQAATLAEVGIVASGGMSPASSLVVFATASLESLTTVEDSAIADCLTSLELGAIAYAECDGLRYRITEFVCLDSASLASPYSLGTLGRATTHATLSRADIVATVQRPTTNAGLRRAYSLATQRPC